MVRASAQAVRPSPTTPAPALFPPSQRAAWKTFAQKIDHFGDGTAGTFPQRYCVYDTWWKTAAHGGFTTGGGGGNSNVTVTAAAAPGPILFYTGNESPVEEYINNTGLMWELGEALGALLVHPPLTSARCLLLVYSSCFLVLLLTYSPRTPLLMAPSHLCTNSSTCCHAGLRRAPLRASLAPGAVRRGQRGQVLRVLHDRQRAGGLGLAARGAAQRAQHARARRGLRRLVRPLTT